MLFCSSLALKALTELSDQNVSSEGLFFPPLNAICINWRVFLCFGNIFRDSTKIGGRKKGNEKEISSKLLECSKIVPQTQATDKRANRCAVCMFVSYRLFVSGSFEAPSRKRTEF